MLIYLLQLIANEVDGLKDGVRRTCYGNDLSQIRNVNACTRLLFKSLDTRTFPAANRCNLLK